MREPASASISAKAAEPRATCPRCARPLAVCYCAHLSRLETKNRVVVLQHPREEGLGVGTARMASLCLPNSEIHVGVHFGGSAALSAALSDPERPAALLYPGDGAIDVDAHPPTHPITLIVIDGTWPQAKKMVRQNPELRTLPRYTFVPAAPSEYRIRHEPREDYLSTIESLAHVLGVIEGDPERFEALRAPFRAMVETQLEYARISTGARHRRRKRLRNSVPLVPPPILAERFSDLVCVVAEANAWSIKSGLRDEDDPGELVHCVALRVATGERLEQFVLPAKPLSAATAIHLEVPEPILRGGAARSALLEAWAAFRRPSDVIVSWGTHTLRVLERAGAPLPDLRVDLRREACVLHSRRVGTIEAFHASIAGTSPTTPPGMGRAGRRVALAADIVRAWTTSSVPRHPG